LIGRKSDISFGTDTLILSFDANPIVFILKEHIDLVVEYDFFLCFIIRLNISQVTIKFFKNKLFYVKQGKICGFLKKLDCLVYSSF
jgi:hypothetical protein